MKHFTAFMVALALVLFSFPAYASPWTFTSMSPSSEDVSLGAIGQVSPMKKGEKAPFDGVLLDAAAAAKIIVDKQEAKRQCEIEIEKEVNLTKAKFTLDLENMRASRDALKKELDARIALKEDHIQFLEKEAIRNAKKASNTKWWLIGGIAIGIALSVGGAFIIREVRGNQPIVINSSGN